MSLYDLEFGAKAYIQIFKWNNKDHIVRYPAATLI
jgi:hypothetical protein